MGYFLRIEFDDSSQAPNNNSNNTVSNNQLAQNAFAFVQRSIPNAKIESHANSYDRVQEFLLDISLSIRRLDLRRYCYRSTHRISLARCFARWTRYFILFVSFALLFLSTHAHTTKQKEQVTAVIRSLFYFDARFGNDFHQSNFTAVTVSRSSYWTIFNRQTQKGVVAIIRCTRLWRNDSDRHQRRNSGTLLFDFCVFLIRSTN